MGVDILKRRCSGFRGTWNREFEMLGIIELSAGLHILCYTKNNPPNMVAKSKEPSEADIISNRINVRHADKLRLIASWLPAPTADELSNAKSEAQLEQEEKDLFAPVPELLVL
jgi:hypothetical protein